MADLLRTNLNTLLANLQAWLVTTQKICTADQCVIAAEDAPTLTMPDLQIVLRPRDETNDSEIANSGRFDRRVLRRLSVIVRTRLLLDPTGTDAQILTNASQGHFQSEDKVIDALDTLQPEDASGNVLCHRPIRYLGLSGPAKDPEPGWVRSDLRFDVPYTRALDQSRQ